VWRITPTCRWSGHSSGAFGEQQMQQWQAGAGAARLQGPLPACIRSRSSSINRWSGRGIVQSEGKDQVLERLSGRVV
jgi:hypothetical protein